MTDSPLALQITPTLRQAMRDCIAEQWHTPVMQSLDSGTKAVLKDIAGLQVRAVATLGEPIQEGEAWWVTRRSLQQATASEVAMFKAGWFGDATVMDICCGIGGDLIALARRGPAIGIDLDPSVLSFADANLRTANVAAQTRGIDVMATEAAQLIGDVRYVHIDPDRRADNQRHTQPEAWMPSWGKTTELLSLVRGGLVKLAPATKLPPESASQFHLAWISLTGSVREQTAIWGELPSTPACGGITPSWSLGGRSAIVIRNGQIQIHSAAWPDWNQAATVVDRPIDWMIDPDAAIRAAGLTDHFAITTGCFPLGGPAGFLTGSADMVSRIKLSHPRRLAMAIAAPIQDTLSCDDRALRRYFRRRKAYPEIIKVRGLDIDPAKLAKTLRPCGETPLALWMGRAGKRSFAVVTALPGCDPSSEGK